MPKYKEKLSVVCFGYNGANNTGSEAKLLTTLSDIKEVLGNRIENLAVLTLNAKNQRRYLKDKHPDVEIIEVGPSTPFKNPGFIYRIYRKPFDLLFLSEGSTFIDHFSSLFLWAFLGAANFHKRRGNPVIAYANDCGHLKPFNQKLLKKVMNKVDLILLRNPDAAARFREYGVTRPIHVTADGAYNYPLPPLEYRKNLLKKLELEPEKRPVIGIAPKEFFWWPIKFKLFGPKEDLYMYPFYHSWQKGGKESSQRYVEQSARHADWCVETFNADIAIISMEHMDFPPSKRIYDLMKHKDRARLIASDEYVVDDIISVLSVLKFLITTRYHACVLSSCSAVPMIAVSSDTRCEAVFRELDIMDLYIDYVKHPKPVPNVPNLDEVLIEMTKILAKREDELKKRIADAHVKFVERANQNKIILKKWIEENYPMP